MDKSPERTRRSAAAAASGGHRLGSGKLDRPYRRDTWDSLIAGRSGVDYITSFDTAAFETKIGAEVKGFDAGTYVTRKQAQRMDRFTQFAVAAAYQAIDSARLTIDPVTAPECGVIIGNSVCGLLSISREWKVLTERGPDRVSPILAPTMKGDAASVQVSLLTGAMAPTTPLPRPVRAAATPSGRPARLSAWATPR
jgi:3-oxoacyl-[acyl-carrier-protein] synthase II